VAAQRPGLLTVGVHPGGTASGSHANRTPAIPPDSEAPEPGPPGNLNTSNEVEYTN
jgi:hypothetical protein